MRLSRIPVFQLKITKRYFINMATITDAEIQQRYTQLLEQRIAQLEALVNAAPKAPEVPKADDKSDTKTDANEVAKEKENGTDTKDKGTETDNKKDDEVKPTTRYRNILRKWDRTAGAHKDEVFNSIRCLACHGTKQLSRMLARHC